MAFHITTFTDVYANSLQEAEYTPDGLGDLIRTTEAPAKDGLPLLKLARFGSQRSAQGSLRHDNNVVAVTGIEGDYDDGVCSFQEAVDRLEAAEVSCLVYTTPSHTATRPRWRVLCPFSRELLPGERPRMLNRLNGLLGGVLTAESWALSQGYYFGHINGNALEVHVGDNEAHIDELDELDATAQPYRPAAPAAAAAGGTAAPDFEKLSEIDLLELIRSGAHFYRPARRLAELWAKAGVAEADAEANLGSAFDAVPAAKRTKKWRDGRGNIPKWIKKAFARVLKKRAYLRALVAHLGDTPPWQAAVRLNEFAQRIEVSDPFPPQPGQVTATWREILDPEDILETLMYVQETGFDRAAKGGVRDALVIVARRNAYHPVRDWLNALSPWDGEERVKRLFHAYFPAELPEIDLSNPASCERRGDIVRYLEETAFCFMVGAVARIFVPGAKVDTLPVLVGKQGWNKSQGIQALVPEVAWFSDDLSTSLLDKDAKESLSGKWILELAEFPHIRREIDRVKAFFSRQTDRYRRAYAVANRDWPRSCVFIATTNELELMDPSGNRRFWPVLMSAPVDVAAIVRDRQQLWAEALHWFHTGFKWWLSPSQEAIAAEVAEAFAEEDIWDDPIAAFVDGRPETTLSAVLTGCLGYTLSADNESGGRTAGRAEQMRTASCLRRLHWHRDHRRRIQGRREWIWVPSPP